MSYKTVCAGCGKPIELLKDPEGKVYHGYCFNKAGKKVGGK